jgi:Ca2+-binding RTX toxin-like protein
MPGSPAIDAGDNTDAPATDQRGLTRPQDGDGTGATVVDIGAFEVAQFNPTIDASGTGGNGTADAFAIRRNGANLEIYLNGNLSQTFAAALTGTITINGSGDHDTLTADFSGGNPIPIGGILFAGNGAGDNDTLVLAVGAADLVTHSFASATAGSVKIDGRGIAYTGLEPITDELVATDRLFAFGATADQVMLDDGDPGDGNMRLSSAASSETVDFANPTGNLIIAAGEGNDTITLNALDSLFAGSVIADGRDGNDVVDASVLATGVTLVGGTGDDSLTGGSGDDLLSGDAGQDLLNGRAGNDQASGGAGDDTIFGGAGSDQLSGGAGNDRLNGQGSNDSLTGGAGNDTLIGGVGSDTIIESATGRLQVFDTHVNWATLNLVHLATEPLSGVERAQLTAANSSAIEVNADWFSGETTLIGGAGDDTLYGGSGHDRIEGGGGSDTIRGRNGDDLFLGGDGDDTLNGGAGDDTLLGEDGRDALSGLTGNDFLNGNADRDTLVGGADNDTLLGGAGADIVLGGDGDDLVKGQGSMSDTLAGGNGDDTLDGPESEIDEAFTFSAAWIDAA